MPNDIDMFIPEHIPRPRYRPANYPVFQQAGIVILVLLAVFIGFWVQADKTTEDADSQPTFIMRDLTENTELVPLPSITDVSIEAQSALVLDVQTGKVLFEQQADEVLSLASITKLMTALVVTDLIETDTPIIVSPEAVAQYGNSGLRVGEVVTANNLKNYALLSSSNDAAYALAVSIGEQLFPGEGSRPFIDAMNIRAEEIGLTETMFQNPTGLDMSAVESGALGSARDVTTLMAYIVTNHPDLLQSTHIETTRIYNEEGGFHEASNTNPLISNIPNVLGSKTGYTDLAGGNLTIAYDIGFNRPIVITVLNSSFNGRFRDVQTLLDATRSTWQ